MDRLVDNSTHLIIFGEQSWSRIRAIHGYVQQQLASCNEHEFADTTCLAGSESQ
jgi:hypothetical protein